MPREKSGYMYVGVVTATAVTAIVMAARQVSLGWMEAVYILLALELAAYPVYRVFFASSRAEAERMLQFMQRISDLTFALDLPMGCFALEHARGRVYISGNIAEMYPAFAEHGRTVPLAVWAAFLTDIGAPQNLMPQNLSAARGLQHAMFLSNPLGGALGKWYKVSIIPRGTGAMGAIIDVTEEMLQRHKLEYERNFDALTGLLSRQAFISRAQSLLSVPSAKVSGVLFADLDNLKRMNDTYGHEFGDQYLRAFADQLSNLKADGVLVGRNSGDEFIALFVNFDAKEDVKAAVRVFFDRVEQARLVSPDSKTHGISFSAGLAYAPSDSRDVEDLLRFADHAMYQVKRSGKNDFAEFNKEDYFRSAEINGDGDLLDLFIEEQRVKFAYQPIVDARTGGIFAHEMLMRPMLRELKTPGEVLKIARSQSKLYQLEQMTFRMIFDWTSKHLDLLGDSRIFINSIPSHTLTKEDFVQLNKDYPAIMPHMTLQVKERDITTSQSQMQEEIAYIREMGGAVGVDDFGAGYSSGISALETNPEFIKVDMSLTRGVDKDVDKWQLVQNIVAYAAKRGIGTVAEGVESYEELAAVIRAGVRYVQGYYLGKPDFEMLKEIDPVVKQQILDLAAER